MFTISRSMRSLAAVVSGLAIMIISAGEVGAVTKLKVFILAGQSNTMCCATSSELPQYLKVPQKNVKLYGIGGGGYVMGSESTGEMAPIAPWPTTNGWGDLRPDIWAQACETCGASSYLTLARDLAAGLPNDSIAIIICCAAPTTLAVDWLPPSSDGSVGSEYNACLLNGVKTAISKLGSGYQAEIAGMCWIQGESDAQTQSMAAAYRTNLTNLINDLRRDHNAPRMPFVIGMIDTVDAWPLASIVRTAETEVAASIAQVGINDTKGFPKSGNDGDGNDDPGHYRADGHIILGTDFAASMLRLLRNPMPGTLVEPSDLIVAVSASGQVRLTWRDNSTTETGFVVERKTAAGSFVQIGTTAAGSGLFASYTDNTVSAMTSYSYRVKAQNGASSTSYSNEFTLSPFGNGDGLKAEYFSDTAFKTLKITQVDAAISWNGNTAPAAGISASSRFSVRWTGSVVARYSERYAFLLVSDMMGKVWINDSLVVDPLKYYYRRGGKGLQPTHSGQFDFTAGRSYNLKVEYYVNTGPYEPMCYLKWKSPSQAMEVISPSQLYQSRATVVATRDVAAKSAHVNRSDLTSDGRAIIVAAPSGATVLVSDVTGRTQCSVAGASGAVVDLRGMSRGVRFVTVKDTRGVVVNRMVVGR